VFNERYPYQHLKSFTDYYHWSRTHLPLQKDSPEPRPIQRSHAGRIIAISQVGVCAIATSGAPPEPDQVEASLFCLFVMIVIFGSERILSPH
jgi:hypothetical protein